MCARKTYKVTGVVGINRIIRGLEYGRVPAGQSKSHAMPGTQKTHLWLRAEVKPFEHRTPVTPDICKKLLDEGRLCFPSPHRVSSLHLFLYQSQFPAWHAAFVRKSEHRPCVLLQSGFRITVEKSHDRCVPDEEYAAYVPLSFFPFSISRFLSLCSLHLY